MTYVAALTLHTGQPVAKEGERFPDVSRNQKALRTNNQKITTKCDFRPRNAQQSICGRGFAPDPNGEA